MLLAPKSSEAGSFAERLREAPVMFLASLTSLVSLPAVWSLLIHDLVLLVLLVLVFSEASKNSTSKSAKKPMPSLVAAKATS